MKKYIRISLEIVKYNLVREMEFRANFFLWLGIQAIWVGLQIFVVQVLFQYTNEIYGWTKPEIFFLIGMYRIIRGIFDFFIYANLVNLPESIDTGDLDYSLTKPVNSLYFLSFKRHQYDQIGTFFTGVAFLVYSWQAMGLTLTSTNVVMLLILLICGFAAFYALILFVSTLSFFLTRLSAINSFHDIVNSALRFPTDLLLGNRFGVSLLLLPMTIIATIPAKIILGKISPIYLFLELFSVTALLIFVYSFWKYAIKRYSSASS